MVEQRSYGRTGLKLSALGLGAAQLGDARVSEADAEALLAATLDAGINLLDTAPSYGLSEQRLGRYLGARREQAVISTKLGYGVAGIPDWTGACITAGVEQALRVLRTDRIDIAHLHSCPWRTLAETDVVDALERAKRDGKLRAIAYSGENDDLDYAIAMDRFDGFMASLNLFDQRLLDGALPRMSGRGFIAKRTVANHPWRFDAQPVGDYCEPYWLRMRAMELAPPKGMDWGELALRFTLSIPGVSSAIVGTARAGHLLENVEMAAKGALEQREITRWQGRFRLLGNNWPGQV